MNVKPLKRTQRCVFSLAIFVAGLVIPVWAVFAQGGSAEKAKPEAKSKVSTAPKSTTSTRRRERSSPVSANGLVVVRDYTFGHTISASAGGEMIAVESFDSPISIDAPLILKQGQEGICANVTYQVESFSEGALDMRVYYRGKSVLAENRDEFTIVNRGSGKSRICQPVARNTLVDRVDFFLRRKMGENDDRKGVLTLRVIVANP